MARWKMEEWAHDGGMEEWPIFSWIRMEEWTIFSWLTMEEWTNGKYFHLLFNAYADINHGIV